MFTKKPDKWKKYSVSIIVLAASFRQIWSSSDFSVVQVTSVEKRESREHFSASAYGLGFKKLSLDSLFSTSVTWTTLQSDEDKFVLRLGSTIIETKYYCSYKTTTKNKNLCPFGLSRKSQNKWENGLISYYPLLGLFFEDFEDISIKCWESLSCNFVKD